MSQASSFSATPSPLPVSDEHAASPRPDLPTEQLPVGWLPRVLRPRDLTVLCLFAVLLITNVQTLGSGGPVSFLYWGMAFLLFLLPSVLASAQLYRLFPGEGAVYLWANKAFGSFWDCFLGFFCNWWPGVLGLTVEASAVVSSIQVLNSSWLPVPWQQGIVSLVVLLVAQALCFLKQQTLQRLLNVVMYAYASIFVLVGIAGVGWIMGGHHVQTDFSAAAWQVGPTNYPLFAAVTVAMLGVAIPLNQGGEVSDEQLSHTYLWWGMAIIIVGYLFATFGALVVLSPNELKSPAFISLELQHVFGHELGGVLGGFCTLILIVYFVCATAAFNMMFSRLLLVAGVDRRLPSVMGTLSINRVPWNAMLFQTAMNIVFVAILFFVTPRPSQPELSLSIFLVVMNGASTVWYIAMIALFLCGIILCITYSTRLKGRWIVPAPIFYLLMCVGILASCLSILATFFFGSPVPDVLSNEDWTFWVLLIVLASLTVGAIYSFLVPEVEDLAVLSQSVQEPVSLTQPQTAHFKRPALRETPSH